ncbi:SDR family NAD(P)-dependent oxidoreductase [Spongiivirga citrea]|uniref:SDR family NAD(P)-dependent oxidoreductase n=1 Tax=Spongiivirga citrea TaxID=1481457 RepID=A0A6M0CE72_9FLAO|nr:SDR family NAD(P)-dependent oxidoreductase [Spongiivirga citrea]NER16126.1 SDR family NAD(P)-dependent oxidoreductase [Spongiivirga citrea]
MELNLRGKTAFISGSTSGIGFATALTLLQEGASVIINGRNQEGINNALERLKSQFPQSNINGIAADFSNPKEVQLLIEKLPNIDILINNVGIYKSQTFFETTDDDWQNQMEVNLMSGVRLSRNLLPKMLERNWGRILFISSECASLVPEDLIAYSTTKASLLAISRGLAQLTKGKGVTVNTIIPGSTLTEGAVDFLEDVAEKENKTKEVVANDFFKEVRTSSLLQRFASVDEVASTITYYSSPLAAATNGAAIKIDGGSIGGIL